MEAPGWVNVELVWRVGAGAVWLVSAAMLVWALVAGRSRGRARCPGGWVVWPRVRVGGRAVGLPWRQGCWYDVSGARADGDGAVVCPECGRRQSARALERTRRRWRWAAAACVLALGGGAMWVAPHERIGALLEALRRAQATHQAVEASGVVPGQRVRVVPLCGLLLETADRAPLPGIPEAVESELLEYMVERLEPDRSAWSLQFVARMAVICGDDGVHAVFDEAVEALRSGAASGR